MYNKQAWILREANNQFSDYRLIPKQMDFLLDDSKRKAFVSGRRCGKTMMIGFDILYNVTNNKYKSYLIIAKHNSSCVLLYNKILKQLKKMDLLASEHKQNNFKKMTTKTGCVIEICAEPNDNIETYFYGKSYDTVYIDEAGFFINLEEVLDKVFIISHNVQLLGVPLPYDLKFAYVILNYGFSFHRCNVYDIFPAKTAKELEESFREVLTEDALTTEFFGRFL